MAIYLLLCFISESGEHMSMKLVLRGKVEVKSKVVPVLKHHTMKLYGGVE
jgi:hypothetical protein